MFIVLLQVYIPFQLMLDTSTKFNKNYLLYQYLCKHTKIYYIIQSTVIPVSTTGNYSSTNKPRKKYVFSKIL